MNKIYIYYIYFIFKWIQFEGLTKHLLRYESNFFWRKSSLSIKTSGYLFKRIRSSIFEVNVKIHSRQSKFKDVVLEVLLDKNSTHSLQNFPEHWIEFSLNKFVFNLRIPQNWFRLLIERRNSIFKFMNSNGKFINSNMQLKMYIILKLFIGLSLKLCNKVAYSQINSRAIGVCKGWFCTSLVKVLIIII